MLKSSNEVSILDLEEACSLEGEPSIEYENVENLPVVEKSFNEIYTHAFEPRYKIIKSAYFPNNNCFVTAIIDKQTKQYYMKTFDLRENLISEIKKDKMRYKISEVAILYGQGSSALNFMCIATERNSSEVPIKSVLKVHRILGQFC